MTETESNSEPTVAHDEPDNWAMLRDVAVLQVKLLVDGFRDLVLVPTSLVAGMLSLLGGSGGKPAPYFYRLLGLGKQSERWINLFGAAQHSSEGQRDARPLGGDIDDIVGNLEKFVVEEYHRGGVTRQAKDQIDHALERIQRRVRRKR
jgi:hypothetical protein